jgi:hypothetical protein
MVFIVAIILVYVWRPLKAMVWAFVPLPKFMLKINPYAVVWKGEDFRRWLGREEFTLEMELMSL